MNPSAEPRRLFERLRALGVEMAVEGETLVIQDSQGSVTPADLAELKERKALLAASAKRARSACERCGWWLPHPRTRRLDPNFCLACILGRDV